jgi:hypothetical protein
MVVSELLCSYFAGFYEGEGYVSNDKSNNNRMRLGIDQNDPTPLHLACKIWGGTVRKRTRKSPASQKICTCHTWRIGHNKALIFFNDIEQYMRIPYKINQMNKAKEIAARGLKRRFQCNFCSNTYANPSGRRRHEKKSHINSN